MVKGSLEQLEAAIHRACEATPDLDWEVIRNRPMWRNRFLWRRYKMRILRLYRRAHKAPWDDLDWDKIYAWIQENALQLVQMFVGLLLTIML